MVTLLNYQSFAVIPLLRGNSNAPNQSHLQNFSAYIVIGIVLGKSCSQILQHFDVDPDFASAANVHRVAVVKEALVA